MNIGREQDGGKNNFERPIVVIKKVSPDTFYGVPLSTKKKIDTFQSPVTHEQVRGFALLDQVRIFDSKRLLRKIGTASRKEFQALKDKLSFILK